MIKRLGLVLATILLATVQPPKRNIRQRIPPDRAGDSEQGQSDDRANLDLFELHFGKD